MCTHFKVRVECPERYSALSRRARNMRDRVKLTNLGT